MTKLAEVTSAKALMLEAMDWSVFKWLWEKRNVRQTADNANAALDRLNKKTKTQWDEALKAAYRQLRTDDRKRSHEQTSGSCATDPQVLQLVRSVKNMDNKAQAARMDAEATFDEAERQLSTSLAREGCKKAIRSWELHERAIRAAEALISKDEKSRQT